MNHSTKIPSTTNDNSNNTIHPNPSAPNHTRTTNPEWDRILSAAQKNNAQEIQRLIVECQVSPNHTNAVGQSALHIAVLWGNVEATQILLQYGANTNTHNQISGATPLHAAVLSNKEPSRNRVTCAQLLVQQGAHVHRTDFHDKTPLQYVEEQVDSLQVSFSTAMKDVLTSTLKTTRSLVFDWISTYDSEKLSEYLLKRNKDTRKEQEVDRVTEEEEEVDVQTGFTPLLHAIHLLLAWLDPEKELPSNTAFPTNAEDSNNDPEHRVSTLVEMIRLLLHSGADPNRTVGHGQNHLPNVQMQKQYLSLGNTEELSKPPLHDICLLLRSLYTSSSLPSPPMEEISTSHVPTTKAIHSLETTASLLQQYGAWTTYSPMILLLHDAARRNHLPFLRFLILTLQMNPNQKGRQGLTPLHFAARSGHVDIVRFLFSLSKEKDTWEIDVNVKDDLGMTPLEAAKVNEKGHVVRLFQEYFESREEKE